MEGETTQNAAADTVMELHNVINPGPSTKLQNEIMFFMTNYEFIHQLDHILTLQLDSTYAVPLIQEVLTYVEH